MDKLLEQLKDLVALTASPEQEEARTAAFKVCKSIRENNLKIVRIEEVKVVTMPTPTPVKQEVKQDSKRSIKQIVVMNNAPCWVCHKRILPTEDALLVALRLTVHARCYPV